MPQLTSICVNVYLCIEAILPNMVSILDTLVNSMQRTAPAGRYLLLVWAKYVAMVDAIAAVVVVVVTLVYVRADRQDL